ncbi:MAG: hypothetical protein ACREDT_14140 [Methylocella sp.]
MAEARWIAAKKIALGLIVAGGDGAELLEFTKVILNQMPRAENHDT